MIEQKQHWVHDCSPFLIHFPDNPLGLEGIRYYGLAYLLSFFGAWILLILYDKKDRFNIQSDLRSTLMTAIIIGVLAGGRLGYLLFYNLESFLNNPILLIRIDQGGMSSHGGFIGVTLAIAWFANRYNYKIFELGDIVCTLAPIGFILGRIANFINGELWGRTSEVAWAVIFPQSPRKYDAATGTFDYEPRHPSQLYEATLEGGLLLFYMQFRFWKTRTRPGQLAGEFLLCYGIVRIIGELFRQPDAPLILGLSRGQFYSVFVVLAGLLILKLALVRHRTS